jgi:AbrB family looped-hinge helix DNA binding protein
VLAKKTSKNQITLPKRIADQFPAVDYFEVTTEGGRIVLRPVEVDPVARVQAKLAEMGLDDEDVRDAVNWARTSSE